MTFSAKFLDALTEEVFSDDEGAGLHDAIYEAIEVSYTPEQLKAFFKTIGRDLQVLALQWGLSDTQFRDDVYMCLQRKKIHPL